MSTTRDTIQRLERRVARNKELYESSLAVVRRYQRERQALIHRIELMAQGAYTAYRDQFVASIPKTIWVVVGRKMPCPILRAFFKKEHAEIFCKTYGISNVDCPIDAPYEVNINEVSLDFDSLMSLV